MRRRLIAAGAVAAVLAAGVGVLALNRRSRSPEVLLERLARGQGDRQELIMQLNVVRGDVTGPMIRAFQDRTGKARFRADVLELLFKRYFRTPEERIEKAILAAAKDPEPAVRRRAAAGLATYAPPRLQAGLIELLTDTDPGIRRQVYLTFGASLSHRADPESGLWALLSDEQRGRLIEASLAAMKAEPEADMRLLARAIIGREVEVRGYKATHALQTSDIAGAERLLKSALELDPDNQQAQVRLMRFYLKTGDREGALSFGRKVGAVFEIPKLSAPPVIDGDPADPVWSEALAVEKLYQNTSRWVPQLAKGKSRILVGHRDGTLYIAVLGYETQLEELVRRHTTRDSPVWRDDCAELIFDPDNTEKNVYQFVINPLGALFDKADHDEGRNFKCQHQAGVFQDRGYWACEFALVGADLDNHPIRSGTMWSMNLLRTRVGPGSEQCAMWPTFSFSQRMYLFPLAIFK